MVSTHFFQFRNLERGEYKSCKINLVNKNGPAERGLKLSSLELLLISAVWSQNLKSFHTPNVAEVMAAELALVSQHGRDKVALYLGQDQRHATGRCLERRFREPIKVECD